MNKDIERLIEDLRSNNDSIRMDALKRVLELTESKVDFGYFTKPGFVFTRFPARA